ncbi:MAG TPA: hypothetical protein VK745_23480 [Polyangiaceae bacterium]|nr:hypothetical protein [Polyangiaceae bacterium]
MNRRVFLQIWGAMHLACSNDDARAKKEADDATKAISSALTKGSPESDIVAFFRRSGWWFDFGELDQSFAAEVYRSQSHVVTAVVYVDKQRRFLRANVVTDVLGMP